MRVIINHNPLAPSNAIPADFRSAFRNRPAWIAPPKTVLPPEVTAYRLHFELPQAAMIRAHVSADERYQLFLNGQRIGRGPERGSDRTWFYETYDLDLSCGLHRLTALVWRLGEIGPLAQIGLVGGFLLEAEGPFGESIPQNQLPGRPGRWMGLASPSPHYQGWALPGLSNRSRPRMAQPTLGVLNWERGRAGCLR